MNTFAAAAARTGAGLAALALAAVLVAAVPAAAGAATAAEPGAAAAALASRTALASELAKSPFNLPLVVRSRDEGRSPRARSSVSCRTRIASFAAAFASPQRVLRRRRAAPEREGVHARPRRRQGPDHAVRRAQALRARRAALTPRNSSRRRARPATTICGWCCARPTGRSARATTSSRWRRCRPGTRRSSPSATRTGRRSQAARRQPATWRPPAAARPVSRLATSTRVAVRLRGIRGVVERNAMRHYLALITVLDTARCPERHAPRRASIGTTR